MVELARLIVEAEQQGGDLGTVDAVAEAADHAVGGAQLLDLQHRPLARLVGAVELLGDNSVERSAGLVEPGLSDRPILGER